MQTHQPAVYGLDIETDTSTDGLDPTKSQILAVAVATESRDIVLTGDEEELLLQLDDAIAALEPGIIATWNGSGFDLPFIADRAAHNNVTLGLAIARDPRLPTRTPLPGHCGSYRATWLDHAHLDAYRVYRNDLKRSFDISCSLKSVAALAGIAHVHADASRVHQLDDRQLRLYVASDARVTRLLALRRWPTAERFVDRCQRRSEATAS